MNATIVAAITGLVLAAPTQAEPSAPSVAATTAATAAATQAEGGAKTRGPGTRYCYSTEATGSHIIQRVCHTRAEWKELGVKVPERL